MSYLSDVNAWLEELLHALPEDEREPAIRAIEDELIRSYRNGLAAGQKEQGKPGAEKGRRRDLPPRHSERNRER